MSLEDGETVPLDDRGIHTERMFAEALERYRQLGAENVEAVVIGIYDHDKTRNHHLSIIGLLPASEALGATLLATLLQENPVPRKREKRTGRMYKDLQWHQKWLVKQVRLILAARAARQ